MGSINGLRRRLQAPLVTTCHGRKKSDAPRMGGCPLACSVWYSPARNRGHDSSSSVFETPLTSADLDSFPTGCRSRAERKWSRRGMLTRSAQIRIHLQAGGKPGNLNCLLLPGTLQRLSTDAPGLLRRSSVYYRSLGKSKGWKYMPKGFLLKTPQKT